MKIEFDKIPSVTKNCNISRESEISENIITKEGAVIAVEALEDKKIYNKLELRSGRMAIIKKGDILAVALGNRRALRGFSGSVPKKIIVGDTIQVLNIGGVAGIIESENLSEVGKALNCKVLGAVVSDNKVLNIKDNKKFEAKEKIETNPKLILVTGTCMNSGKTVICAEIINKLRKKGKKVAIAKVAGIAAIRDLKMCKDYGAFMTSSMIDAGLPSSVTNCDFLGYAKAMIDYLQSHNPDFIVIEFGDGLLGEYGVLKIISDKSIISKTVLHVSSAQDPVGAKGAIDITKKIKNKIDIISGPVTDNTVGKNFIERELGAKAANAIKDTDELFKEIEKIIKI